MLMDEGDKRKKQLELSFRLNELGIERRRIGRMMRDIRLKMFELDKEET